MNFHGHFKDRSGIRWGMIGCGDVTEVKSGPGFQKAEGSALVAVMRRQGALAADYARRHAVPRWYEDADALIADPEVDAIYVATPPDTHAEYALQAAAAGKPAYVEKPMARHTPECDRMTEAFQRAHLPLFVAYYRRCLPRFVTARELISNGALGRVTGVRYHFSAPKHLDNAGWRVNAAVSGGGHFLDIGSHAIDLLDFFFGPLTGVAGVAGKVGGGGSVEDAVTMSFLAGGEIPGAASWNFAGAEREDTFIIAGTGGRLCFSLLGDEPLRLENAAGVETRPRPTPPHVQQPLIQSVVADLLGRGECPSSGESARRASQVMDTVLTGYYGGRADEFWRRPETWPGRRANRPVGADAGR
jgi:predicted dehydrogenase